jgi:cobalt-zinc-cadmium efflux system membrane fusion protein
LENDEMNSPEARNRRWVTTAAAAAVAAAAGFGIAKITSRPGAAPPAPAVAAGPATLQIEPAQIVAAGIVVQPIASGNLNAEIVAPASVASAPNGEAVVTAHAAGAVTHLTKRLGDPVRAGEVLALVESKDAAAIAAQRTSAEARANLARQTAARERRLYEQRGSPRQDVEQAQAELVAAEAEARGARNAAAAAHLTSDGRAVAVTSPLSGRITVQTAALGAFVQPETELFRVADPRFVQVQVQVTAADAARIAPGDPAVLAGPGGAALNAMVRSVTPALDPNTRAATVVLALSGQTALTPGETLQARITPKAAAATGIVVPEEAIQNVDGRDAVFVRTAKGFRVQPVTVGSRGGGRASIVSGVKAGQSIATRNAFLLKAEFGKGAEDEE